MTLLFTPRMGSGGSTDTNDGPRRRFREAEPEAKKVRTPEELHRARVLRRRLRVLRGESVEEPVTVILDSLPSPIESDLFGFAPDIRARLKDALTQAVLEDLRTELLQLETAQIEKMRLLQLWERVQEEEALLMMVMM